MSGTHYARAAKATMTKSRAQLGQLELGQTGTNADGCALPETLELFFVLRAVAQLEAWVAAETAQPPPSGTPARVAAQHTL